MMEESKAESEQQVDTEQTTWKVGSLLAVLDNEESRYSIARVISHIENGEIRAQYLGTLGKEPETAVYKNAWVTPGDKVMLSPTKESISRYKPKAWTVDLSPDMIVGEVTLNKMLGTLSVSDR